MTQGAPLTRERLEQWRAVQPQGWRGTVLPAGLWVLLIVLSFALTWKSVCTPTRPCGTDWLGAAEVGLCLLAPVLLLWAPRVGVAVSTVAALAYLVGERVVGEIPWPVSVVLPLLVLLATASVEVRRRSRRAAARALLADLPRTTVPGPVPPPWLPRVPVAVGALAVLAAFGMLGYGVVQGRAERAAELRARQVTGTVVGHGDDGYLVRVSLDDRTVTIDTLEADDYPVGSRQPLLVSDEVGVRLVAEPYDASGWALGALLLGALGLTLAGRTLDEHRRVRRFVSEPQPVQGVRVGWTPDGAQVLAREGGDTPLVGLRVVPADLDAAAAALGADPPARVEPAQLLGTPVGGDLAALVLDDGLVLLPDGPVRRPDPEWRSRVVDLFDPAAGDPAAGDPAREPDGEVASQESAADVARWRSELLRPEWWRVPLGVAFTVGAVVAAFFLGRVSDGVFTTLWRCALVASFAFDGLVHLATRVSLTADGLVHDGPTTRRTVPWKALEGLTVADGAIVLARVADEVLPLTWLPHRPRFGGKARRHAWARRWVAVLAAEARQAPASTDVTVRTEPRLHAAVLALAFTAAVLAGLWSRGAL